MIPFLIVVSIAGPVLVFQWWTWPTAEQQRLRRLSRDLRGTSWAPSVTVEAERIARAAWAR